MCATQRRHVLLCVRDKLGVPQAENEARVQSLLALREPVHCACHDLKQAGRVVVRLHVNVELDVLVARLHEQRTQLLKRRDLLHRLLECTHVLNAILAVVGARRDQARAVGRAVECLVVEHDDHVVSRHMDICESEKGRWYAPLSMQSAPSLIACANELSVFSGNSAEAWGQCTHGSALTPRWPLR